MKLASSKKDALMQLCNTISENNILEVAALADGEFLESIICSSFKDVLNLKKSKDVNSVTDEIKEVQQDVKASEEVCQFNSVPEAELEHVSKVETNDDCVAITEIKDVGGSPTEINDVDVAITEIKDVVMTEEEDSDATDIDDTDYVDHLDNIIAPSIAEVQNSFKNDTKENVVEYIKCNGMENVDSAVESEEISHVKVINDVESIINHVEKVDSKGINNVIQFAAANINGVFKSSNCIAHAELNIEHFKSIEDVQPISTVILQRFEFVQSFIDDRYHLKSDGLISYSKCIQGDELELAKAAFFVLSEVVRTMVFMDKDKLNTLALLEINIQEDLEQCFQYFITNRNFTKKALERMLCNNSRRKFSSPEPHQFVTPRRSCNSKYRKESSTPAITEDIYSNSPLRSFFESPIFKKEDMRKKDKEIGETRKCLIEEEIKVEELLNDNELLRRELFEKAKEAERIKEQSRAIRDREKDELIQTIEKQALEIESLKSNSEVQRIEKNKWYYLAQELEDKIKEMSYEDPNKNENIEKLQKLLLEKEIESQNLRNEMKNLDLFFKQEKETLESEKVLLETEVQGLNNKLDELKKCQSVEENEPESLLGIPPQENVCLIIENDHKKILKENEDLKIQLDMRNNELINLKTELNNFKMVIENKDKREEDVQECPSSSTNDCDVSSMLKSQGSAASVCGTLWDKTEYSQIESEKPDPVDLLQNLNLGLPYNGMHKKNGFKCPMNPEKEKFEEMNRSKLKEFQDKLATALRKIEEKNAEIRNLKEDKKNNLKRIKSLTVEMEAKDNSNKKLLEEKEKIVQELNECKKKLNSFEKYEGKLWMIVKYPVLKAEADKKIKIKNSEIVQLRESVKKSEDTLKVEKELLRTKEKECEDLEVAKLKLLKRNKYLEQKSKILLTESRQYNKIFSEIRRRKRSLESSVKREKGQVSSPNVSKIEEKDRSLNFSKNTGIGSSSRLLNASSISGAFFDGMEFMSQDEDDFFESKSSLQEIKHDNGGRFQELRRRNSVLPLHLQSSYPLEMNLTPSIKKFYVPSTVTKTDDSQADATSCSSNAPETSSKPECSFIKPNLSSEPDHCTCTPERYHRQSGQKCKWSSLGIQKMIEQRRLALVAQCPVHSLTKRKKT